MSYEIALEELLVCSVEARYYKGEIIVGTTDNPQEMFYIVSGRVGQYDISSSGYKVTVNSYGVGSFFSLSWLYGAANDHYYEALEDCCIKSIPLKAMKKVFETDHAFSEHYISKLMRGLNGLYKRLSIHMVEDAQQRIIYELLLEVNRFHKENKNSRKVLTVPISTLASNTGLTRETVSREISRLIKEGYIEKQHRSIIITDVEKLKSISL